MPCDVDDGQTDGPTQEPDIPQVEGVEYPWVWYYRRMELTTASGSPILYANGAVDASRFYRGLQIGATVNI